MHVAFDVGYTAAIFGRWLPQLHWIHSLHRLANSLMRPSSQTLHVVDELHIDGDHLTFHVIGFTRTL